MPCAVFMHVCVFLSAVTGEASQRSRYADDPKKGNERKESVEMKNSPDDVSYLLTTIFESFS